MIIEATESREFIERDELREKRKNINTFDDLVAFLKDIEENYGDGYGEAPRSMAQACVAVGAYFSNVYGITGFQASFVMWDFIRDWAFNDNECGLKLVDYDDMLYPQYEYNFEKVISAETWEALQKTAKAKLDEEDGFVCGSVRNHWQSIVDGHVPFGYVVKED